MNAPIKVLDEHSITKKIASSGPFHIELMKYVGLADYESLIKISESLIEEYGKAAKLTEATIQAYFNKKDSLPFIARHQGEIIGYIIGVPIEILNMEPWARLDSNFGKNNTLYTYAFVIKKDFKKNGYAKMLKKVFLNWAKKKEHIHYVTGHVRKGIPHKFKGNIKIVDLIDNWQGTGKTFEYYRRELDPDHIYKKSTNKKLMSLP